MKVELGSLSLGEMHDLLSSALVPLPIVLVSSIGKKGIFNAAPYSLVFPVCWKPPTICLSIGRKKGLKKDTLRNIEATRDFVLNIMSEDYIKPLVQASKDYPYGVDEIREVGLTAVPAERVKSPLVAEAAVSLECRLVRRIRWGAGDAQRDILFGEVVLLHVKDNIWGKGTVEPSKIRAVGRMGGGVYCKTSEVFYLKPS